MRTTSQRLRNYVCLTSKLDWQEHVELARTAADEIDALRAALFDLREYAAFEIDRGGAHHDPIWARVADLLQDSTPPTRYFLAGDNSGHEYVVPVGRKEEWFAWLEIPEDDERSWDVPEYAKQVDGGLTFTDPRDD